MRRTLLLTTILLLASLVLPVRAADMAFTTSDGVRLHVIEAGSPRAQTIVLVPGWTMPAWIFQAQINAFSRTYHVVALDPRGQGDSDIPPGGYNQVRSSTPVRYCWSAGRSACSTCSPTCRVPAMPGLPASC